MTLKEAREIMHIVKKYWCHKVMCSDACKKFMHIMEIFEVETRHIGLIRPSMEPLQGHSICEAKIEDEWICFDIAFGHCSGESIESMQGDLDNALAYHPIYKTHYEELMELYKNYRYYKYTKKNV